MAENAKKPEEPFIPKPYMPADAVSPCAQPGYKAGNPILDEFYKQLRIEVITKKFKKLYETLKPKK